MKGTIIFFLMFVLVASSPVYSAKKDKLMAEQLQRLEDAVKLLDEKVNVISAETGSMSKILSAMEEKVNAITRNQADGNENKEKLMVSLQFIKEELNELKNSVNKINDRLVSLPPSNSQPDNNGAVRQQEQPVQPPETSYYAAYTDYMKKNYPLAVEGFKQFLKAYPKHDLADNAMYWVGECYYSQKMFQEAVSTFTELIVNFPEGDKLADAILKKGYSLIEMGKQAEGLAALKDLISRFPLSEEASLAQQKIKEVTE